MIETFKLKMDKNYEFNVDINKSFEEQNILEETKAIFANIFRDYWATPYQKERIEVKEEYDRQKLEEEKREKYNSNDLFKNSKKTEISNIQENEKYKYNNNLPIKVKKNNLFKNIIQFLRNFFKRN